MARKRSQSDSLNRQRNFKRPPPKSDEKTESKENMYPTNLPPVAPSPRQQPSEVSTNLPVKSTKSSKKSPRKSPRKSPKRGASENSPFHMQSSSDNYNKKTFAQIKLDTQRNGGGIQIENFEVKAPPKRKGTGILTENFEVKAPPKRKGTGFDAFRKYSSQPHHKSPAVYPGYTSTSPKKRHRTNRKNSRVAMIGQSILAQQRENERRRSSSVSVLSSATNVTPTYLAKMSSPQPSPLNESNEIHSLSEIEDNDDSNDKKKNKKFKSIFGFNKKRSPKKVTTPITSDDERNPFNEASNHHNWNNRAKRDSKKKRKKHKRPSNGKNIIYTKPKTNTKSKQKQKTNVQVKQETTRVPSKNNRIRKKSFHDPTKKKKRQIYKKGVPTKKLPTKKIPFKKLPSKPLPNKPLPGKPIPTIKKGNNLYNNGTGHRRSKKLKSPKPKKKKHSRDKSIISSIEDMMD